MDDTRFDALARALGARGSRRWALVAFVGVTLAGSVGRSAINAKGKRQHRRRHGVNAQDDTPKPNGKKCNKDTQCLSGHCCREGGRHGTCQACCTACCSASDCTGVCQTCGPSRSCVTASDGTVCGTGGQCDDGRCFQAFPGTDCAQCGNSLGVAADSNGVNFCTPGTVEEDCSGQTCTKTADCPAGQFCEIILCSDVLELHCAAACPA